MILINVISTEKLSFMDADMYCKSQYIGNTSALVEVLTVEVGNRELFKNRNTRLLCSKWISSLLP